MVHVIPEAVFDELKEQSNTKRRDDFGHLLTPYTLINLLHKLGADEKVSFVQSKPTLKDKLEMYDAMKSSHLNKKGNSRIGEADYSVANFVNQFQPEYSLVVSCDSDIAYILNGLDVPKYGYLKPDQLYSWLDDLFGLFLIKNNPTTPAVTGSIGVAHDVAQATETTPCSTVSPSTYIM